MGLPSLCLMNYPTSLGERPLPLRPNQESNKTDGGNAKREHDAASLSHLAACVHSDENRKRRKGRWKTEKSAGGERSPDRTWQDLAGHGAAWCDLD